MVSSKMTQELRSLVEQSLPHGKSESSRLAVKAFMDDGTLSLPPKTIVDYSPDILWEDGIDRSLARYLHGLLFLRDWPESIKLDASGATARSAVSVILDWYDRFPNRKATNHSMAFHDETTAQRLIMLITILNCSDRHLGNDERSRLDQLILETSDLLLDDDFHSTGNNHGMFQDIALRSYAALNDLNDENVELKMYTSLKRLNDYFSTSFTEDGVHKENSPTYHLMITKHLAEQSKYLKLIDGEHRQHSTEKLLEGAAKYATHAVLPSGVFLPLSDTQQTPISAPHHNVFNSPEFRYATSAGKGGSMPSSNFISLPKSGYFYARNKWGSLNATFVAFVAAYNSDYHKHSDDLSLYIWHNGIELISEAGPYGYNYQLPLTKYGFGQYAHNNIVVNGTSVSRTDAKSSSVWMQAATEDPRGVNVIAGTGRLKDTYHERKVAIARDFKTITVEDRLQSLDNNNYECVWNLGTNIRVVTHGDGFELFSGTSKIAEAYIEPSVPVTITIHHGQMKPKPLGWRFPNFGEAQATNTILVSFAGSDVAINTSFSFKDFQYSNDGLANMSKHQKSLTNPAIDYMIEPGKINNNRLLVFFMGTLGDEGSFRKYNNAIDDLHANKLFIYDDFGDKGSYYWLRQDRESIYDSVQNLIRSKMIDLNVSDPANVSMFGFSAGGTAAILHGSAIGAGVVFAGAPQFAVGSYLEASNPSALKYMTRGASRSHAVRLDALFRAKLDSFDTFPRIYQFVDSKDKARLQDGCDLRDYVRNRDHLTELMIHTSAAGVAFEDAYYEVLEKVARDASVDKFASLRQYDISLTSEASKLLLHISNTRQNTFSLKLYRDSELVSTQAFARASNFEWDSLVPGQYRVRIYERSQDERMPPFTTQWITVR